MCDVRVARRASVRLRVRHGVKFLSRRGRVVQAPLACDGVMPQICSDMIEMMRVVLLLLFQEATKAE
jgi:hypothetical protein